MLKAWEIHRTLNHLQQVRWYTGWWLCVVVCSCKLQCTPLCSPLTWERWKLSWRRPLRWLKVHYGCLKRPPFWYIWNTNWVDCILVRILDYEIANRLTLDTSSRLWKKSGLQRDLNPWPSRYRCVALPTELWSHTLGARSIYWVHISREESNDVKYMK